MRKVAVGTVKRSIETSSAMWLSRNDLQFYDGGFRLFGIQRETARSEMSIPSFKSSPCTLGAPQKGFEFAILRIKSRISGILGRGKSTVSMRPGFLRNTMQYLADRKDKLHYHHPVRLPALGGTVVELRHMLALQADVFELAFLDNLFLDFLRAAPRFGLDLVGCRSLERLPLALGQGTWILRSSRLLLMARSSFNRQTSL
jgi:hypothetical protein